MDKHYNPKICDFGISNLVGKEKIYDTGGTPAYLAPEVIQAEGDVCYKTDV
jgi:serine/threonine protein kinase